MSKHMLREQHIGEGSPLQEPPANTDRTWFTKDYYDCHQAFMEDVYDCRCLCRNCIEYIDRNAIDLSEEPTRSLIDLTLNSPPHTDEEYEEMEIDPEPFQDSPEETETIVLEDSPPLTPPTIRRSTRRPRTPMRLEMVLNNYRQR